MSDAAIFATVFVSIFVLRIVAATLVFLLDSSAERSLPELQRGHDPNAVSRARAVDALVPLQLVHHVWLERHAPSGPVE